MREIRFRVWDKRRGVMMDFETALAYLSQPVLIEVLRGTSPFYEAERSTELPDKDGIDICEGDIIKFAVFDYNDVDTQYMGVIKWCGSRFMIWHDNEQEFYGPDGGFDLDWVLAQYDETKIIGNVRQNPELLEPTS